MELNTVRPFLTKALDQLHMLRTNIGGGLRLTQEWSFTLHATSVYANSRYFLVFVLLQKILYDDINVFIEVICMIVLLE